MVGVAGHVPADEVGRGQQVVVAAYEDLPAGGGVPRVEGDHAPPVAGEDDDVQVQSGGLPQAGQDGGRGVDLAVDDDDDLEVRGVLLREPAQQDR